MLPNPEVRALNAQDVIKILKKRLWIIVAALVIIPTVTTVYAFRLKSMYRASASIVLTQKSPVKLGAKIEDIYAPQEADPQYVQTQYKILGSRSLIEKVFTELNLKNDPYFRYDKDPVGVIKNNISVGSSGKESSIIVVSCQDEDPVRAARIVNSLVKFYIAQSMDVRNEATKEAISWLEAQLKDIKGKIELSEKALSNYIQGNKIIAMDEVTNVKSLLENLKGKKSDLGAQLAELTRRYKSKHPRVIYLEDQLANIDKQISEETKRYFELNAKMVEYNVLKQEVDSNKSLYVSLLSRAKEMDLSEKLETANMRLLDSAYPPGAPFKPDRAKMILNSVLFSLFLGVGLAFLLEYLDSNIHTADDVSSYINLPFLGYIPPCEKEALTDKERGLISYRIPTSRTTESFRALRTSILFSTPEDKPLKSIVVTSSLPQEGKSFVSENLAIMFAQVNERVLLVDVDMRRPKLHRLFEVDTKPGLSTFLTGSVNVEALIRPTPVRNLSLITAGPIPPNPTELLTSSKVDSLWGELENKFDRIIFDSPPMLVAADTALLSSKADGIIFVVRGGRTRLGEIIASKKKIMEAKGRIIGLVLNGIEPEKEDRYYYYHYHYYDERAKEQGAVIKK